MASISKTMQLGSYWKMTLNVSESSTSTANNTSALSYSLVLTSTGGSAQYNGAGSYAININGSRVRSGTANLNVGTYGSVTLASGSTTVGHNNDGSKTVSVSASYSSAASAYYLPSSGSTSGSLTLTKIPRASKIDTFTGSTVDGTFNVTYTKSVSTYTDKLRISIPNVKALMTIDYTSGKSFNLDSTSLEYIYSNYTTTQTVQLGAVMETYNGTTKIGESSEYKIDVSINCPPTINGVALTETGLTGAGISNTDCVALIGKKSIKVTATAQHHASIKLIQVQNGNVTKSVSDSSTATLGFDNLSSASFVVTVTDSRGFTASKTVTGTYYDYFKPTIQSLSVARPTDTANTATISGNGTFWNGTIGTKANTITYTITDDASVSDKIPTISNRSWLISKAVSNVPYQSSFHFTVTIKDAFGQSETRQITLPSTTPVVWIGKKTVRINGTIKLSVNNVMQSINSIVTRFLKIEEWKQTIASWKANVEEGNTTITLNRYSNYSEKEIDTHTTWIDGKTIYKKTVRTGLISSGTKQQAHGIKNLVTVVKMEGIAISYNREFVVLPRGHKDNEHDGIALQLLGDNVKVVAGAFNEFADSYVTVYYTKE